MGRSEHSCIPSVAVPTSCQRERSVSTSYWSESMIRWTSLTPWEFEFPFPGSLTSTSYHTRTLTNIRLRTNIEGEGHQSMGFGVGLG